MLTCKYYIINFVVAIVKDCTASAYIIYRSKLFPVEMSVFAILTKIALALIKYITRNL